MRVEQADTTFPALVVADPEHALIAIHPSLNHQEAVDGICKLLGDRAHPEAVEHWVERVLPTVDTPLRTSLPNGLSHLNGVPQRRHKRHARPAWPVRLAWGLGPAAIVAIVMTLVTPTTTALADAWNHPIFQDVATAAEIACEPLQAQPLRATCTDALGATVEAEAFVGPDRITYKFRDAAETKKIVVIIFASSKALRQWEEDTADTAADRYPNLHKGDRVVIYGTDPGMLMPFIRFFEGDTPDAADVARVLLPPTFAMGLLPHEIAASHPGLADHSGDTHHPPAEVQYTAAAIIAGDARLHSQVSMTAPSPFTNADPVVTNVAATPVIAPSTTTVQAATALPTATSTSSGSYSYTSLSTSPVPVASPPQPAPAEPSPHEAPPPLAALEPDPDPEPVPVEPAPTDPPTDTTTPKGKSGVKKPEFAGNR